MSIEPRSRPGSWSSATRATAVLSTLALAAIPTTAGADVCSVGATPVAFGSVSGGEVSATGTITFTCNGGGGENPFAIALSAGAGAFAARTMTRGANSLSYNLYADPAHTQIWGDGSSGTVTVAGNFDLTGNGPQSFNETVYGLVPAQSLPPPGVYFDTIVVTLTF